ncbi:Intraflagellar transport protein 22 [Amphibalanus amphitrite]|uniref:Intraflagellar transport protein 22 n=1 Tax=Amphibalanus amphitrite TaxID=1232801 RepID=A0A6A4WS07_AMPAM|nr:intraflagellar transport protein 22 homolog [Amphibalanus amphitrite]KAF0306469.1 Intraflagellar transport protein 22 [Amphibalanus amphitrite]KAF0306470.1 Intraflagellar transport protein 22 [Amphibalanus amphitrite]
MVKIKLLLVGPVQSGKTHLANFLADAFEFSGDEYWPTKGARILEFDVRDINVNNRKDKVDVELWDVSGDRQYEGCWPAIQHEANGVLFVYSASRVERDARELEALYTSFVQQQGLRDSQCLVIAHQQGADPGHAGKLPGSSFATIPQVDANLDANTNQIRSDFNGYVSQVAGMVSEAREKAERDIVGK